MSTVLLTVHDVVGPVLAVGPTPEAPPASGKLLQLVRYLSWLALLLVPVLVIVVVIVGVRAMRSRSAEPTRQPQEAPPSSPPPPVPPATRTATPPTPRTLRGGWHVVPDPSSTDRSSAAPDLPLPGADGWPPPDPTVWGRPSQS